MTFQRERWKNKVVAGHEKKLRAKVSNYQPMRMETKERAR